MVDVSDFVVRLLPERDDRAFTRREVADAIGVAPETVGTNLTRLKRRGLVRHREPYRAIVEDRGGPDGSGSPGRGGVTSPGGSGGSRSFANVRADDATAALARAIGAP